MIYLIGGAPRAGKSLLGQQLAAEQGLNWTSTDMLWRVLEAAGVMDAKKEWDASPEAITAVADCFYPYLEHFLAGASSLTDSYIIDGVDFLPAHVDKLAAQFPVRAIFLGCTDMTLAKLDLHPGRTPGYASLPEAQRRQIAADVPRWSAFVQGEAEKHGYPFVDTSGDFHARLKEARRLLLAAAK